MIASANSIGSDPVVAIVLAVLLLMGGRRIANHVGKTERDPRLTGVITLSLVLHLLCAPAQIVVVDHIYHGVADYGRYVGQGLRLSENLRSGHFTLAGTGITHILNDGSVSIISGIALTILGPNKLAEFLLFAGLSFVGDVLFYKAFSVTFPEANRRRYAYMLFFLPSLLFWTADISKESIMTLALGICAYGVARVLARLPHGYLLVVVGSLIAIAVRPNELLLLAAAFAVAMFFRGRDPNRRVQGIRRILTFGFIVVLLGICAVVTEKLLSHSGSLTSVLQNIHADNTTGPGQGLGSSNVSYSANPLYYLKDVYAVLFDPLPITAHGGSQLIAAAENSVIIVYILTSLRQLRAIPRVARWKPYVLACIIYSLAFFYVFAALGNLGLIDRERTLLLPFFLVLLAIPLSPKGGPPKYPWEQRYLKRKDRARHAANRTAVSAR